MFELFKKKSEAEQLQLKYESLMKEWHLLSSTNRSKSDAKYAEAQKVLDILELTNSK